jgi:hypothetical protein
MLIDGIISLLTNTSSIRTLATGGIHEDELPRGYSLPAVCVHQYGGSEDTDMAGPIGLEEGQVQFDIYATSGSAARALGKAIEAVLKPFTGSLPEGTSVKLFKLERSMAMPFSAKGDQKGIANRYLVGLAVTFDSSALTQV